MRTCSARAAVIQYLDALERGAIAPDAHLAGGGHVQKLEQKLARHYGMRHALCVSNASMGLYSLALALEMRDTAFVTTPYTYGASIAGWLQLGNTPIFADIDPLTLTLDPSAARRAITGSTRAILAVDILGNPSDSAALRRAADEHGLWYIADASQSLGASRSGRPASSYADALVLSFTAGKTLFAGEGGAVLTNNRDLFERLVWHTQHADRQRREIGLRAWNEFALNARIHPLAAAWADARFETALRAVGDRRYRALKVLEAAERTGLVCSAPYARLHIFPSFYRVTAAWKHGTNGAALAAAMRRAGIAVRAEACPVRVIYRQAAFRAQFGSPGASSPRCAEAEWQERHRFCLTPVDGTFHPQS